MEITQIELFKELTYIDGPEEGFDLHNDYNCTEIVYGESDSSLSVFFESVDHSDNLPNKVCLAFQGVSIVKFNLFFNRIKDSSTINSIYRGRFERDGKAFEYSENGDVYFYIQFEAGDSFEFFSRKAFFLKM